MVFRGNIVACITGDIFSYQGLLFGTFLMKNIFIKFPTPIFNHVFCSNTLKFSCFFEPNLMLMHEYRIVVQTKPMKIIAFFDEIMQKIWFKIGVGNLMKIFFIRNVPNNIPWSLKMFPVMPATIFPRKTMKNSRFFLYVDYCRASHSKCMHCGSFAPTQWDHFLGRRRAGELL